MVGSTIQHFFSAIAGTNEKTGLFRARESRASAPDATVPPNAGTSPSKFVELSVTDAIRDRWPLLTEADIESAGFMRDLLAVRIVERYGISLEWSRRQIDHWAAKCAVDRQFACGSEPPGSNLTSRRAMDCARGVAIGDET